MKYSGGKSRSANSIAGVIRNRRNGIDTLVSPFMGGLAVELELVHDFSTMVLSDIVPDLAIMWAAIRYGWLPPDDLSESQYNYLKRQPPSALRGFAGFGASFGGKWFGGYGRISAAQAHRNGGSTTCAQQVARGLRKDQQRLLMTNAIIFNHDYRDLGFAIGRGAVVYADPPYRNTLGYAAAGAFNTDSFWHTADQWTQSGALVFVSEEIAPSHWRCVWEKNVTGSMDAKDRIRTERLFMHESQS